MCNLGATVEIGCHNCAAIDPLSGVNEPGAVPAVRVFPSFLLLLLIAAAPALAQQEPPARVGRVGYASGDLSFRVVGESQWSQAGVNYPVATGGSFWTDPQGRAEIGVGPTTVRLAGGTELDIVNLNEQTTQLGLPQGRIYLRLRQIEPGRNVEVDLPRGGVWLLQPGAYDIAAGTTDQPGHVQVFEGSARFAGGGADLAINAGDAAILTGSDPVAAQLERAAPDPFVEWCQSRDADRDRVAAPRHVSPQMTGYADLDRYGDWQNSPQYGAVWYPTQVPSGWAPYRDGRWISVPPWGWTWVDDQPWGFAPSHYGRWAYMGNRWGWVPGQFAPQPVYAPALVAFVGAPALGLALAAGPAVGWFPLAPNEVYWPSYTRNAYYIRNVNITNVHNINTVIVGNQGAPPAQVATTAFANRQFATVVPQGVFAASGSVAPAMVHVPQATLKQAPVSVQPPRVTPVATPARVPGPPIPSRSTNPASANANHPAPNATGQPPSSPQAIPGHAPEALHPAAPSPAAALPPAGADHPREPPQGTAAAPGKSVVTRKSAAPGTAVTTTAPGPSPGSRAAPGCLGAASSGARARGASGRNRTCAAACRATPAGTGANPGVSPARDIPPGIASGNPCAGRGRSGARPSAAGGGAPCRTGRCPLSPAGGSAAPAGRAETGAPRRPGRQRSTKEEG